MNEVRCPHCGKKLAEGLTGKLVVTCPRCKRLLELAA